MSIKKLLSIKCGGHGKYVKLVIYKDSTYILYI